MGVAPPRDAQRRDATGTTDDKRTRIHDTLHRARRERAPSRRASGPRSRPTPRSPTVVISPRRDAPRRARGVRG
eukprot:29986-Pelagococcus_subviridis.AAC.3